MKRILPEIFSLFVLSLCVLFAAPQRVLTPRQEKASMCFGRIRIVDVNENFRVRVVNVNEDLRVRVSDFSHTQGQWRFVDVNEDYRVRFVDVNEDFSIRFVNANEGLSK